MNTYLWLNQCLAPVQYSTCYKYVRCIMLPKYEVLVGGGGDWYTYVRTYKELLVEYTGWVLV